MQFNIITIFPEIFTNFLSTGLVARAKEQGLINVETTNLREFAINSYGQIDDTPYGGGSGLVLRPEPALQAIQKAKTKTPNAKTILFSPRGRPLTHDLLQQLTNDCAGPDSGLILFCSRYEGIDQRIVDNYVDLEISLGDFILMGGEVPAMSLIEGITRLIPGVLGNPESLQEESFREGLLEYPQYTKPQNFMNLEVPQVLLSGNHKEIARWRKDKALKDTLERRPDLVSKTIKQASGAICGNSGENLNVALIHYPVRNKNGEIVTSSITNIDIHDIARSAKTYDLSKFYVVHPTKILRQLALKICEHWESGYGATYNPNRREALQLVSVVSYFEDVIADIELRTGKFPKVITSSAKKAATNTQPRISFIELKAMLATTTEPYLLLLGTGWGLSEELLERADYHLEPINSCTGNYNHLSVRAAASIMFDRLFGDN